MRTRTASAGRDGGGGLDENTAADAPENATENTAPATTAENTASSVESAARIAELLGLLFRLMKRIAAAQHGTIEPAAFLVLGRLAAEGPRRAGELAAATCADPSTVSRQVAALVRAGLVERRADPQDGRATQLAPTADGIAALAAERRRRAGHLARVLDGWPAEARTALGDLLERFVTDLQDSDAFDDLLRAPRCSAASGAHSHTHTSHDDRSTS